MRISKARAENNGIAAFKVNKGWDGGQPARACPQYSDWWRTNLKQSTLEVVIPRFMPTTCGLMSKGSTTI
ncbi:hypothetical protein [Paenibacillus sp. AR247]|uniref:hypothetical protein n=1 Tax=Paenibacillus sp. AR247 TaxID=1631599 RepID=UPI0011B0C7C7|nr:hypothetical protein [Paenibacillus sp. AR247]